MHAGCRGSGVGFGGEGISAGVGWLQQERMSMKNDHRGCSTPNTQHPIRDHFYLRFNAYDLR